MSDLVIMVIFYTKVPGGNDVGATKRCGFNEQPAKMVVLQSTIGI
jgi:hypothetical protein